MFPRLPLGHLVIRLTLLIATTMLLQIAYCKPQGSNVFENAATRSIAPADTMENAGLKQQKLEFEAEERRKRSLDFANIGNPLMDGETFLESPIEHQHLHRDKRSPCRHGGGGGGGGTGGGGTTGGGDTGDAGDDEDLDVNERRRRARRRNAASRRKATNNNSRKIIDIGGNEKPALTRRKRQADSDNLNGNKFKINQELAEASDFVLI